jgi:hypothetical protein
MSWYTGDATANTWIQDFSPLVLAPPLPGAEIAVWPIIPKMIDGTEPSKFEWIEEQVTPNSITLGEAMDTTETTWTIAAGDIAAAGIRVGVLLKNLSDRTKKEIVQVIEVTNTTTLEVVRDYGGFVSGSGGGTTGEEHADAAEFEIVAYLNPEGSSVVASDYKAKRNRDPKYNYYSLIDDWDTISASDMVRVYRGSTPDNWGYQMEGLKQRFDRIFEKNLIHSPQVARATTAASGNAYGSMGGIMWYATQTTGASGYSYVTTADTFDYEVFDDGVKYLYEKGTLDGSHDIVCLMPPAGVQAAAYIHASAQVGEYVSETVRGLRCTTLMSTITGDRIPLVPSVNIPSDSFMLLNLNALRVHFLKGRALSVYNSAVGEELNDWAAARLISELTLEFQRPVENCYLHTGITYSRA